MFEFSSFKDDFQSFFINFKLENSHSTVTCVTDQKPASGGRNEKYPIRPDSNPKSGRVGSGRVGSGRVGSGSGLKINFFRVRVGFRVSTFLFGFDSGLSANFFSENIDTCFIQVLKKI